MKPRYNKPLVIAILCGGVFVVVVIAMIVLAVIHNTQKDDSSITIQNYGTYVKNLSDSEKKNIEMTLYSTVSKNSSGSVAGSTIKDASIRDSSYSQSLNEEVYTTRFIVDIPSIKQSYEVKDLFSHQPVSKSGLTDYTTLVLCLDKSQLKYGDFNCQDRISEEAGLQKSDPILQYLPVSNLDYDLSLNSQSDTLKLTAKLNLTGVDYTTGEDEAVARYKAEIQDWFTSKNLDINNYSIEYTY